MVAGLSLSPSSTWCAASSWSPRSGWTTIAVLLAIFKHHHAALSNARSATSSAPSTRNLSAQESSLIQRVISVTRHLLVMNAAARRPRAADEHPEFHFAWPRPSPVFLSDKQGVVHARRTPPRDRREGPRGEEHQLPQPREPPRRVVLGEPHIVVCSAPWPHLAGARAAGGGAPLDTEAVGIGLAHLSRGRYADYCALAGRFGDAVRVHFLAELLVGPARRPLCRLARRPGFPEGRGRVANGSRSAPEIPCRPDRQAEGLRPTTRS